MEPNLAAMHTPSHTSDIDGIFKLYPEGGKDVTVLRNNIINYPGEIGLVSTPTSVNLSKASVKSVSSKGNVLVSESVVSKIEALGKVTLKYGAVGEIETESNEGCLVEGSSVNAKITAKRGPVTVIESYVRDINAFGPVDIEHGVAGAVTIRVDNQRNGINLANLRLNDAKVCADVTVKLREQPSTPQDSSFSSGEAVSRNSSVENKKREIIEDGQSLIFYSSTDRIRRYYDLMLTGKNVQYPLLPRNIKFLQKHYKEPIDISTDGIITNTHGKYVLVKNKDFPPNCTLRITGDGEIKGEVVFKNCRGTVVRG